MTPGKEQIFEGLGVSPGIAFGTVHLRESGSVVVPEYKVAAGAVDKELTRLKKAVTGARRQIGRLKSKAKALPGGASDEMIYLLDAYSQMLENSRLVRGAESRISDDRINAEAAVQAELSEISATFANMKDSYLAARLDDIRDVAGRLIRLLVKSPRKSVARAPKGSIIVAEDLPPADTAQMDPARIAGFATALGGAEGHTAIMARALGLPSVLGAADLLSVVRDGDAIIIDGDRGRIVVNPKPSTAAVYERRHEENVDVTRRLNRTRNQPSVTQDGTHVTLQANVELPVQLNAVGQAGAEGVGLLRSEFMFMNRDDIPSEDEQFEFLKDIVESMDGRPVTIRTLDIGGEKLATSLLEEFGDSVSSALGLRGIRLSLAHTQVFETQIAAILRAGAYGPVRFLLPMVSNTVEVRRAKELIKKVASRLKRRKVRIAEKMPPIGIMIEVPGAALSSDALAQTADFFAIGTNDLTMYTLAIDRTDEQVANLYNPLHPAVLRLIQFSAESAFRTGIPVSVCGEMAGDPRYTALLLGLGIRDLSMGAGSIPRVKQRLRSINLSAAEARARVIMDQVDSGRIAMLLEDFNALA
ncbi:MAG: phosphoenolpyruvate--protein phosphotransferase [Rhodospirillaceae bacterium]|nr:phosphoenolpyruvate--protein phosphotransferase [Rhodospirillaceae bacterium]